jgi:hypothetical protein
MRTILAFMTVFLVGGTQVHAGRNANGAMIVHTSDAVVFTSTGDYCGALYNNPGTCGAAGTRTDKSEDDPAVVWFVAAFLNTASPAVTGIQFGIEHNLPPDAGAFAKYGACGTGVLELPEDGWPETAFGNTITFSGASTSKLFPFYYFAAYGFAGAYVGTGVSPNLGHALFTDDANPPGADNCYNFGRVLWYQPGFNECPTTPTCQVTVTSPNGGEIWNEGSVHTITWSSSGCEGPVQIDLIRTDGLACETIAVDAPNSGAYGWVAQNCLGGTGSYKIRITDLRSGRLDESNQSFFVPDAPACLITVIAPDGGETIDQAGSYEITWGSTLCGANVKIELIQYGSVCATISASTPNDGTFLWTAQPCAGMCGYKIRVTDFGSGAADESAEEFCFRPCAPHVDAPNGGEEWIAATEYEIRWSPGACGATAKIELLRNGLVCSTIAAVTPNDGSFLWTAQPCAGATDGYRIRVTDLSGDGKDESDATFRILSCQLAVTAPNGGESWQAESVQTVTWTANHCGGEVRIELLRSGVVCATLAASTPNDGSFLWTVAQCGGNRTDYRIRITDLRGGLLDESDAVFSIPDPACAIQVTAPNGGESWTEGLPHDITWTSAHCGGTVKIELLLNNTVCSTISASTVDDGLVTWTAQRCGSATTGYKIRITDLTFASVDESDVAFSIPACQLTITSPSGGSWAPGSSHSIVWTSQACGSAVKIDLLRNGSVCTTISASTANDGEFLWTAQQCTYGASGYRVRLTDLATGETGQSELFCISCDDFFAIPPSTELTVGHTNLTIPIEGGNDTSIRGYTIRVCFDPAVLECTDLSLAGTRGAGASAFTKSISASCATGTVTFSPTCPPQIPPGTGTYLNLTVNVKPTAPLGPTTLTFTGGIPPSTSMTTCAGTLIGLSLQSGSVMIVPEKFRRGDDNADGVWDIADPVYCLDYQYGGGPVPPCRDAGDFDDSGRYDIADCVANLCWQFGNCSAPPPPFASCGTDPTTGDALGCAHYTACGNDIPTALGAPVTGIGCRISFGAITYAGWDSLIVPIRLTSLMDIVAMQYSVAYDPAALTFAGLDRSVVPFDFYAARPDPQEGRARAGVVPDLGLTVTLAPGEYGIGRLLFVVSDPARLEAGRIDIADVRVIGVDRVARAGDGASVTPAGAPAAASTPRLRVVNPYRPGDAILLDLPEAALANVAIFNVSGQKVRSIFGDADLRRGRHSLRWDGKTESGGDAGTGIYYIRAMLGPRTVGRKITLIR